MTNSKQDERWKVKGYDRDKNGNGFMTFISYVFAGNKYTAKEAAKNRRFLENRTNVTITECERYWKEWQ